MVADFSSVPRQKQAQVRKELEEAAFDPKTVNLSNSPGREVLVPSDMGVLASLMVSCIVPTKAAVFIVRSSII